MSGEWAAEAEAEAAMLLHGQTSVLLPRGARHVEAPDSYKRRCIRTPSRKKLCLTLPHVVLRPLRHFPMDTVGASLSTV